MTTRTAKVDFYFRERGMAHDFDRTYKRTTMPYSCRDMLACKFVNGYFGHGERLGWHARLC